MLFSSAILARSRDLTVYVKMISDAYNLLMHRSYRVVATTLLLILMGVLAESQQPEQLSILTKELPPASLWEPYGARRHQEFELRATGGVGRQHWRIVSGSLPKGITLDDSGALIGTPEETGQFQFTVVVSDSNTPPAQAQKTFTLIVETPLTVEWDRKAQVNGQRIDGSVKVSNRTGRDFDLTFIVLAVNDIGRATAIGYQHFPLKRDTRDLSLPFGDTLSPGNYVVNVDVVGEEPIARRIFRARLVTPKETITQGP